jgi:hypothetical protein
VPDSTPIVLRSAVGESSRSLDVQESSISDQVRPFLEVTKLELVALLQRSPVSHELPRVGDFYGLHQRLTRRARLLEELLRPKQRSRDGEVLCRDRVPPLLLDHELRVLMNGSQLFAEQIGMGLQTQEGL